MNAQSRAQTEVDGTRVLADGAGQEKQHILAESGKGHWIPELWQTSWTTIHSINFPAPSATMRCSVGLFQFSMALFALRATLYPDQNIPPAPCKAETACTKAHNAAGGLLPTRGTHD